MGVSESMLGSIDMTLDLVVLLLISLAQACMTGIMKNFRINDMRWFWFCSE